MFLGEFERGFGRLGVGGRADGRAGEMCGKGGNVGSESKLQRWRGRRIRIGVLFL